MKTKKFNFTFKCDISGEMEHVNGCGTSFECPACKVTLKYLEKERRFGAHGKSEDTIGHTLRVAEELE